MSNLLLTTTRWIFQSPLKKQCFLSTREMLSWRKEILQTTHMFPFSSMSERLSALPGKPNTLNWHTIFRVPDKLHKNCKNLIEPSVVSIGPYHHGCKHLQTMQDIKWSLLRDFLSRGNNKVPLKACIERIKDQQLQARSCYSGSVDMDDDDFVKMLVLDGVFIIEFVLKPQYWFNSKVGWSSTFIANDLIMLENQIPFFVVESLWELYFGMPPKPTDLKKFATILCNNWMSTRVTTPPEKVHHLLHLCHHYVVPDMSCHQALPPQRFRLELCGLFDYLCFQSSTRTKKREYKRVSGPQLPCVSKLKEAGIKFRRKKSQCEFMDVTFQRGTLEIPHIDIHHGGKSLFKNLLALEQSAYMKGHLTTYAVFMDSIINSKDDIAILQKQGIIESTLSGEKEIARFFNQLAGGVTTSSGDYLSDLFKEVNRHYNSKCRRTRAQLMHDYLNSPWAIISLSAACILLGLTIAQTYFAAYAHFHPSLK